jgi:AcrR family transcriptional regulator
VTTTRRLNRTAVVDAAAAIVDGEGWRSLTMARLAREVGVQGPTLYSHVQSVEALLGMVQVSAHRQLASDLQAAAIGRTGAAALQAMAAALRSYAMEHPGLYDLAMDRVIDRAAVRRAEEPAAAALAAVISSFGAVSSAELQVNCLATLHGVLVLDRGGFYSDGLDGDAVYARAVEMVILLLEAEGRDPQGREGAAR